MKNLFALLLFAFLMNTCLAHVGGHHEKDDNTEARTWYYKNLTVATKGHFLIKKEGNVYIQISNQKAKIKKIPINKLRKADQVFIQEKMDKIYKINGVSETKIASKTDSSKNQNGSFKIYFGLTVLSILILIISKNRFKFSNFFSKSMAIVIIASALYACSDDDEDLITGSTTDTTNANLIENTSNPDSLQLAFTPYSTVSTSYDNDYFYVASNGIPEHQMMVGITAWIAQVPVPHAYTGSNAWSIPLNTKYAENPTPISSNFQRGAIAIAANGIPIFNPINASGLVSKDIGELDAFGGHSGRGDDYHYHTAPLHLESSSGIKPIAYAFDGYAVYGSKEPDGTDMTDLDVYHGHEYTDSTYHYHGTDSYPYMIAFMRGEVTLEGTAPQNQVSPQSMAFPPRSGNPHAINSTNLIITDLVENIANNGYVLTYTIDGVAGSVDYSWDTNDFFTYIFYDVDGTTTTETFQR